MLDNYLELKWFPEHGSFGLSKKKQFLYHTPMPEVKTALLQKKFLTWYSKNARDLPWRRTKDPYKIWVSEIMLQQTQVQTVIPYYEKWIRRFPTSESLAKADISEALKLWAGLGYYRRARMLHQGARFVAQLPGKTLPLTPEELIKIPGIGRYTAGAIASIAFGKPAPLVDGNVIRVFSRIYALKNDIREPKAIEAIWDLAASLVPQKNAGDFNQSLMELGATVCLPQNPLCEKCPVSKECAARAQGCPEKYPVKKQKEVYESLRTFALIYRQNNSVLLRKQPLQDRWGGLWMFPYWPDKKSMLKDAGCSASDLNQRMTVKHGFTKYRVRLEVYEFKASQDTSNKSQEKFNQERVEKWVKIKKLSEMALPSPHRKIAEELLPRD